MKKIIFCFVFVACQNQPQHQLSTIPPQIQDHGTHQVVTQPGGTQVVVVKDHNGMEFFMEMLMFQQLMNMAGGMNNVYNYRNQHQYDRDWNERQTQYRSKTTTVINNYYGTTKGSNTPTTPVKYNPSSGFKNAESQSAGFSGSGNRFKTNTTTPPPSYTPSTGFSSSPSTYTRSSGFSPKNQSSCFGSKSTRSTGFGG